MADSARCTPHPPFAIDERECVPDQQTGMVALQVMVELIVEGAGGGGAWDIFPTSFLLQAPSINAPQGALGTCLGVAVAGAEASSSCSSSDRSAVSARVAGSHQLDKRNEWTSFPTGASQHTLMLWS